MKKSAVLLLFLLILTVAFTTRLGAAAGDSLAVSGSDGSYTLTDLSSGEILATSRGLTDLLVTVSDGTHSLFFDGVTSDTSVILPQGSLTLSGTLSLSGTAILTVPEGTSLRLDSATVTFSDGYLRVKGGDVTLSDSELSSIGTSAVVVDYSAASHLTMLTGRISSSSSDPTVRISRGGVTLSGGTVTSLGATAILNSSALTLCGSPAVSGIGTDVVTIQPITLSHAGTPYRGELTVRYDSSFPEGKMTEVLYACDPGALVGITLTDRTGREYPVEYFESSPYTDEQSFAAVFLPYTVKLFDGELVRTVQVLDGTLLPAPDYSVADGYTFLGWYPADSSERFDFSTPITSSVSLYAKKQLSYPTFAASSYIAVYDGAYHTVGFDCLRHPLDSDGGVYSYEWYRDGVRITSAAGIAVRDVSDSGSYSCRLTYTHGTESVTVLADGITVRIEKAAVSAPTVAPKTYDGRPLSPDVLASSLYTVSDTVGTSAGSYPVILSLTDPANYRWQSTDSQDLTLYFDILTAENRWTEPLTVNSVYLGSAPSPRAMSLLGPVEFLYSVTRDGSYVAEIPTAVGSYFVRARVLATSDYSGLITEPAAFEILAEAVAGLSVATPAAKEKYTAFDRFNPDGLTLLATYNSGRTETVEPHRIAISYTTADALRYGDRSVMLSFGGITLPYSVTVDRAEYDLTELGFSDLAVTYDGSYHTVIPVKDCIIGLDGLPLTAHAVGGGTDAGVYTVRLVFDSDSSNYSLPSELVATLTVTPRPVTLTWQGTDFVYDGSPKLPTAVYTDVFGACRTANVSGRATKAASGYIATAAQAANYLFENPTAIFNIAKADYDLSGVSWSADSFTYDGGEKRVAVLGLPSGITVIGYTDNRATVSGSYLAVASLTYDSENYNPPPTLTHEWMIHRAEYDLSTLVFSDGSFTYDGAPHYPTVSGELPIGADGTSPTYHFSTSATSVTDGRVAVLISFTTESQNYLAPRDLVRYVEILPFEISVVWQGGSYVYDGEPKLPTAHSDLCELEIRGAGTNAGRYTATATSRDPNYRVANSTYGFAVLRADNGWVTTPAIGDIFESGAPTPTATPISGDVTFAYYSDAALTTPATLPLAPGSYFAVATVRESENYNALASSPLPFRVIAVVPITLLADYRGEDPTAFDRLDLSKVECFLVYNDGTRRRTVPDAVTYQHGDSFRRRDDSVTLAVGDLTAKISVTVLPADYDLSGLRWENTTAVYDGRAKSPILQGLPEGVTVLGYNGAGQTEAGSYTVTALISYDSENYNPPEIPAAILTVHPATVPLPTLRPSVYDGREHSLAADSALYSLTPDRTVRDAGSYILTAHLADAHNYRFEDGTTEYSLIYRVLPRTVDVTVSALNVYLFESEGLAELTFGDGIADGDTLTVTQYIEGDRVHLGCDDTNYRLNVIGGRVHRLPYPSPAALRVIAIVALVIMLLLLIALVIFLRRAEISGAIAAYRSRRAYARRMSATNVGSHAEFEKTAQNNAAETDNIAETSNDDSNTPKLENDESDTRGSDEADTTDTVPEPINDANSDTETQAPTDPIDVERADTLITDGLAKDLLKREGEIVVTDGTEHGIINVDTLSRSFSPGDRVDVNILKQRSLVPYDTAYIKVLARGMIDKPLRVYANDFSLSAIKMIALTGGEAIKVVTVKEKTGK